MADSSYQVIYRAIADFSNFTKSAAEARAELAALQKAEKSYNDQVVKDSATMKAAWKVETDSLKNLKSATDSSTKALQAHTAALLEDAAAARKAAEANNQLAESQRNTQSGTGAAPSRVGTSSPTTNTNQVKQDTSALDAHAKSLLDDAEAHEEDRQSSDRAGSSTTKHALAVAAAAKVVEDASHVFRSAADDVEDLGDAAERAGSKLTNVGRGSQSASSGAGGLSNTISGLLSKLMSFGDGVAGVLGKIPPLLFLVASAFGPLVAAAGAAGGALMGLGSSITSVASLAAAGLPAFFALATSIGSLVTAFSGIKNVFSAYKQQQAAATTATQASTAATQSAQAKELQRMQQVDALTNANHSYQQSILAVANAQYAYKQSVAGVTTAQQNLADAQKAAIKNINDLKAAVAGGPANLDEAKAQLQLSKEALANAMANPASTKGQVEEAQAQVEENQQNVTQVERTNTGNKSDLATAEKQGVAGNSGVKQAQQQLLDAEHQQKQASQQVKDAKFQEAQAQRQVTEAQLQNVVAQQKQAAATAPATAATAGYTSALNKLSPAAQTVVKYLIGLGPAWHAIQQATQQDFFAPIVPELGDINKLLPSVRDLLTQAAGALGKVAANALKMVSSGPWTRDFHTMASGNAVLIRNMGDAFLHILDALRNVAIVALPFTERFSKDLDGAAKNLDKLSESSRKSGTMADVFQKASDRASMLWTAIKNIAESLYDVGKVFTPLGDGMLKSLDTITDHWHTVAKAQDAAGSPLRKWVTDITPLLHSMAQTIGDVMRALFSTASDPKNIQLATSAFQALSQVLPTIIHALSNFSQGGIFSVLTDVLKDVSLIVQNLEKLGLSGALNSFAEGLTAVVVGLKAIVTAFGSMSGWVKWLDDFHSSVPGLTGLMHGLGDAFHFLGDAMHYLIVAIGVLTGLAIINKFTGLSKIITGVSSAAKTAAGLISGALNKVSGGRVGTSYSDQSAQRQASGTNRAGRTTDPTTGAVNSWGAKIEAVLLRIEGLLGGRGGGGRPTGGGASGGGGGGAAEEETTGGARGASGGASGGRQSRSSRRSSRGASDPTDDIIAGTNRRLGVAGAGGAASGAAEPSLRTSAAGAAAKGGAALGGVSLATGLAAQIPALQKYSGVLNDISIATGVASLATEAFAVAMDSEKVSALAAAAADKVMTAAQWLLDAAMDANPVTLIVTALVALGVAVYEAYEHFGPFRKIVDDIGKAFVWFWHNALEPVVNFFKRNWKEALNIALDVFMPFVGLPLEVARHWGTIVDFFKGLWKDVSKIFTDAVSAVTGFITGLWDTVSGAFAAGVSAVSDAFVTAWNAVTGWIESPVRGALNWLSGVWHTVSGYFTDGVAALKRAFDKVWPAIKGIVEEPIKLAWAWLKLEWTGLKLIFTNGVSAVKRGFTAAWNLVKGILTGPIQGAHDVIHNILGKITGLFNTAKTDLSKAVGAIRDALGTAWNKVEDIFKTPIKFVINTVMNDGIIHGVNKVLGWIGLSALKIPDIPLPKGFARGDWVPGHGEGDSVPAMLTPGEFVVRKKAAQQISKERPGLLEYLNNYDRPGKITSKEEKQLIGGRIYKGIGGWLDGENEAKAVAGAAKKAWDATGGKLIHWSAKELRKGAAAFYKDTVMNPMDALLDKTIGTKTMPKRMVTETGKSTVKAPYNWLQGIDAAHKGDLQNQKYKPGLGASQWLAQIESALHDLGQSDQGANVADVELIIQYESGGNPNAINNTDINAQEGHPSQGLMQTIPSTFDAYAGKYKNLGITNPLANIYAGINYALHTYGSLANVPGVYAVNHGGHYVGYAGGGPVARSLRESGMSPRMFENAVYKAVGGSVTNNSTAGHGINIQNLTIQNPREERASDSLPRTIRKMSYLTPGPTR